MTSPQSPSHERPSSAHRHADGAASGRIHLLVGPVGAGKSTFALRLAAQQRAVYLNLDEWMAALFRPDRPDTDVMAWYIERSQRCAEHMWTLTRRIVATGTDAVLEIGLIERDARERFYDRVEAEGTPLTVYVLDAPREVRRERVERRNREQGDTFSMVVPPAIFELASDLWQPVLEGECAGRDVRFLP